MKFVPYITLDGNAAQAVDFYAKVFGATKTSLMRFGEMPDPESPLPEEARNRVLHAMIEVGDNALYLSDTFPGTPYTLGNQLAIAVVFQDEQRIRGVYESLRDGGDVQMELQKTFWSPAFAMVSDRFGVVWQLSLEGGR